MNLITKNSKIGFCTQPAAKTRYWTIFFKTLSPTQTKSICSNNFFCLTMQQLINIAFHNFLIFNVYRYQPLKTSNVLPVLNRIWALALLCKETEFRYSFSMVSVKIHHVRVRFSYSGDVKRSIRNIYNYHNKLVVMVQVVCYYFFS
jgi:hypothetical protein